MKAGDKVVAHVGGKHITTTILKISGDMARLDIIRGARQYGRHVTRHVGHLRPAPTHTLTDWSCHCGGDTIGNGYTSPMHCENADVPDYAEPDSGPWECEK